MSGGGESARSDLHGGVGWMVFGLVIMAAAWRMDRFERMGAALYTAPGLVPGMFGLALLVLGAVLCLRSLRALRRLGPQAAEPLLNRRILLMLALTLVYAIGLIGRLPFGPCTAVFVALFTWCYADASPPRRRIGAAVLSGMLSATVIVLVFEQIFLVRLP